MKKQPALIFFKNKQDKEKYLPMGLLLFFLFFSVFALSENRHIPYHTSITLFQNTPLDSLQKRTADSLFNAINKIIKKRDFAKAEEAAINSLTAYRTLNYQKGIGNCLNKIATIAYYTSDFEKALSYYDQSITIYKNSGFLKGVATSTNNKGAIYYHLGKYPEALEHYKRAIVLNDSVGNTKGKTSALQNIGGIYYELEEYPNALHYFNIAKTTYTKLGNKKSLARVYNSIGEVYIQQKAYRKAHASITKGLHIAVTIEDQQRMLESTYTLGNLTYAELQLEKAAAYYGNALQLASTISNERYRGLSLIGLGKVYAQLNQHKKSLTYCKQGLAIVQKLKLTSEQREACQCLYTNYKQLNQKGKALQYYERSTALTDSLQSIQTSNKILHMEFEKTQLIDSLAQVEKERKVAQKHQTIIQKKEQQRNILIISGCFILIIAGSLWSRLTFTKKSKAKLQVEKDRSEHLLLNILPEEIADELKAKGYVDAQDFESATILFTDFKSFTETASKLTPQELVEEINVCFKAFDAIMETYHIEKIKTIGDAYMAAGGLPQPDANAVRNTILAALDMQAFIGKRKQESTLQNKPAFEMRVGVHVGPIVAGIVGIKKFQYDVWGDTVNTASRMESNGAVGKVNISEDTYALIKEEPNLSFEYRGKINAKGKGELSMYFVSKRATSY